MVCKAAKELHFNRNMEALKRMQAGVDKLSTVVGVTIGPKVLVWVAQGGVGCVVGRVLGGSVVSGQYGARGSRRHASCLHLSKSAGHP
jgi:hypothetical protein